MRVGRGDAERLKASRLPPHPPQCAHWGTCPYPLCPFGTSSLPLLAFGHFPLTGGIGPLTRGVGPLWGEGFGSAQIGRDLPFCGTFGYIYWEFGRSAPVRGRAARCAAPTAETWKVRAACRVVAPYRVVCGQRAGEDTRPYGDCGGKTAGAQCAPL